MIIGVFKSIVNPERSEEFERLYAEMGTHIAKIDGYLGHKRYYSEDGEAVVVVEFDGENSFDQWDEHIEHKRVKQIGKTEDMFDFYDVKVGTVFEHHSKKVDG